MASHSRTQAYNQMAAYVNEIAGKSRIKAAYVHAGAEEEAQKLKQIIEARVDVIESMIAELSPALAVHTGPGTAGLCFYAVD
jgi:fatty acid-binding protein DegV